MEEDQALLDPLSIPPCDVEMKPVNKEKGLNLEDNVVLCLYPVFTYVFLKKAPS